MLRHARTDADGTRVLRDRIGRDAAFAGSPQAIARLASEPWRSDWRILGAPSQPEGLFLLLRPDLAPDEVPVDPGADSWRQLEPEDLEAFTA